MAHHSHPGPIGSPDDLYKTPLPWDIGRPQAAFLAFAQEGAVGGQVLDVGCGTGEHVLMCAGLGLEATGVDLASRALQVAEAKAAERHLRARFLRHDALHLIELRESFDTVLDCGLFHILSDEQRPLFVDSLRSVTGSGGRYLLLCMSDEEPGYSGGRMRHVTRNEITAAFAKEWTINSIEAATIETRTDPAGLRAWLASLTRR